jgi:2-polyprenyl-3-methyl-5-hydroxy-6-metoxy-1,4-benzoquinol methylase
MISEIKKNSINLYTLKTLKDLNHVENFFHNFLNKNFFEGNKYNKKYFFNKNRCLCGSQKKIKTKKIDLFNYVKCECGNIYTNPMIKNKGLKLIYSDYGPYSLYRKKFVIRKKSNKIRSSLVNKRKFKQLDILVKKKNSKILDYGCGDGSFLKSCLKGGYKNLFGIDTSIKDVDLKEKIKFYKDFDQIKTLKFDCITLWGVLEHLNEPVKFLLMLKKKLNRDGKVLFEVPNSESLLMKYIFNQKKNYVKRFLEPGRHLYFFSINYFLKNMSKLGFKILDYETNGLDIQSIIGEIKSKKTLKKILEIQKYIDINCFSDHLRIAIQKK